MTHTRTPLRRTTKVLTRTLAAGSLAGLAVAAFAAPAQASSVDPDDKIWSDTTDGGPFMPPYSVRITGDSPDHFLPPWSVRITGDEPDNREWSVRITGDEPDNREWSVRITELKKFNPDNRDMSVRITGSGTDNRDY
jgi:hypothetical protein